MMNWSKGEREREKTCTVCDDDDEDGGDGGVNWNGPAIWPDY